jgi:hypothetical protein
MLNLLTKATVKCNDDIFKQVQLESIQHIEFCETCIICSTKGYATAFVALQL